MAKQEHLDLLKRGVEIWNQWRKEHIDIQPNLFQAHLGRAHLGGAHLGGAYLNGAHLDGAHLDGAYLNGARLNEATLIGADLRGADLREADLSRADLRRASLRGANLGGAHLEGARLDGAYLNGARLNEATLIGADLRGAELREADLSRADLRRASLSFANLTGADLRNTDLREADLSGVTLVDTNLAATFLTDCRIYGISVWNVQLEGAKQDNLVITPYDEPIITVDDLEVAQFIYLLLNHQKLRNVLNAVTERGVLLLGRFGGGGLEVLQVIAAKLRNENYLPIIFDFERPQDHDYTETVKTLAGLARFVIVDLSGPSVPQELSHTVPFFDIPFVPIIEKGRRSYSMFVDLFKYPWVLRPPIEFATVEELLVRMPEEVIAPAEEKHLARQKLLDELFKKA
jgi:uncharacterized protein YjbI with pentapeptide repeats